MKKKDSDQPRRKVGRPITSNKIVTKSSQRGTKENESRITFIIRDQIIANIRSIAYWKRETIKEVVSSALTSAIEKYEAEEGTVQPIPEK